MGWRWKLAGWAGLALAAALGMEGRVYAQPPLLREYEQGNLKKLEQWLQSDRGLDDFSRVFLRNLFSKDAAAAVAAYKSLIKKNPQGPAVPLLLERIGQYQFSTGLYHSARETFSVLAKVYPESPAAERALYYVARCWQAIGRSDSTAKALGLLRKRFPDSRYLSLISLPPPEERPLPSAGKAEPLAPVFTVQAGAFSTYSNAKIQRQFLENKGYRTRIYLKEVQNRTFYVVCTGRFQDRTRAEKYARRLRKRYHIQYQIVDLNTLKKLQ